MRQLYIYRIEYVHATTLDCTKRQTGVRTENERSIKSKQKKRKKHEHWKAAYFVLLQATSAQHTFVVISRSKEQGNRIMSKTYRPFATTYYVQS